MTDVFALLRACDRDDVLVDVRPFGDGGFDRHLLFARLERAVLNQESVAEGGEGPAMESRYGIWAMTCRDHIAEAVAAIERGDDPGETLALLRRAANSLVAFAAVQKHFDPFER